MANRTCSIDGCENANFSRSWCSKHYARWRSNGTMKLPTVADRCKVPACTLEDDEWCHFPGCGRPYYARGVCTGHAQQLNKKRPLAPLREKRANGANAGKICEFTGCTKPQNARGLCQAHAVQRRAGRELKPLRLATLRDARGYKRCPGCDTWRNEAEFCKSAGRVDGLSSACRGCASRRSRQRNLAKYNVTVDWYDAQMSAQGGGCAICASPPRGRLLSIDHDHACCPGKTSCGLCVRGLLCGRCNFVLGNLEDNQSHLRAAADYLAHPPNISATPSIRLGKPA